MLNRPIGIVLGFVDETQLPQCTNLVVRERKTLFKHVLSNNQIAELKVRLAVKVQELRLSLVQLVDHDRFLEQCFRVDMFAVFNEAFGLLENPLQLAHFAWGLCPLRRRSSSI